MRCIAPPSLPHLTELDLEIAEVGLTNREAHAIGRALAMRTALLRSLRIGSRGNHIGCANAAFVSPWVPLKRAQALRTLSIDMTQNAVRHQHVDGTAFLGGALPGLEEFRLVVAGNGLAGNLDLHPLGYGDRLVTLRPGMGGG